MSKLRQTPRLIQAARDNIKDPPGIFVKVGIETLRGALKFVDHELPRAFSNVDDMHLLGDLADAQAEASQALGAYRLSRNRRGPARPRLLPARPREVRAEAETRGRDRGAHRAPPGDCRARAPHDAGSIQDVGGTPRRRRFPGRVGAHQGRASGTGRAHRGRSSANRRAGDVPSAQWHHLDPFSRSDHRRADPRLLSLVVREHVDPRPVRDQADARLLLSDRRRSVVAARAPGRASARLQPPDALVDFHSRGLSGPLPPVLSTCAASNRRCANRSSLRRRPSSKAGRTIASR